LAVADDLPLSVPISVEEVEVVEMYFADLCASLLEGGRVSAQAVDTLVGAPCLPET